MYTELRLDYRLRLWAPMSASRAISAVAELLNGDLNFIHVLLDTDDLRFDIKNC